MDVLHSLSPELCGAIVVGAVVCVLASRYWRRKQSHKGTKLDAQSSYSREKIIGPDGDQQNPQPCGDHNSPQPQRPNPKFPNAAIQMTPSDFKDQQEVLRDFSRNYVAQGTVVVCTGADSPAALPSFEAPPALGGGNMCAESLAEYKGAFLDQLRQHIVATNNMSSPVMEDTIIKLITVNPAMKALDNYGLMPMCFQPRFVVLLTAGALRVVTYGYVVESPTEVKKMPGVVGPDSQYSGHVLKILSENLIDRDYSVRDVVVELRCQIVATDCTSIGQVIRQDVDGMVADKDNGEKMFLYSF